MAILNGQGVSPCETRSPIGLGGSGEAYHAHDGHRKRILTSRVLSEILASSLNLTAELENEARILSQMNHSNPGPIYNREEFDAARTCLRHKVNRKDDQ